MKGIAGCLVARILAPFPPLGQRGQWKEGSSLSSASYHLQEHGQISSFSPSL